MRPFDRPVGQLHAVFQPLRDPHRPARREPELAARLLRERRGRERRSGPLGPRPLVDRGHLPRQVPPRARPASAVASCSFRCRTPLAESRPVAESKSLPRGHPLVADPRECRVELATLGRQAWPRCPSRCCCGTPAGPPRVRRSAGPRRSGRGPRSARSAPSSTTRATACSRRADRGCAGSPAPCTRLSSSSCALATASWTASRVISWNVDPADRHLRLEDLLEVQADRLAFAVGVGRQQHFGRVLHRRAERGDVALLRRPGRRSRA